MQDKIWNTMKKNEQKNKNYCYSFNVHDWNIDREIKKKKFIKKNTSISIKVQKQDEIQTEIGS